MGVVGYIIGGTLASLLLLMLILIAAKLIGPMKRNPKVVYSICSVLALLSPTYDAEPSLHSQVPEGFSDP
jgi:hypothetical protein